jgi:hypothetical protein
MKEEFPFIEIIRKTVEQKGHPHSMNIIRKYALGNNSNNTVYDYWVQMEDDWFFHEQREYIRPSIHLMEQFGEYRNIQFSKNYGERYYPEDLAIVGSKPFIFEGARYHEHIYLKEHTTEYYKFYQDNPGVGHIWYPHFSFRPGVVKTDILRDDEIGEFELEGHFEAKYGYKFMAKGYKTVFFDTIACDHIGRSRWNPNVQNAYLLMSDGKSLTN